MDSRWRETEENSWSCWLRMTLACSGALIMEIFFGINEAQSSVMLPQLKKEGSFIHVTPDEETWIASLGIIMSPITCLVIGPFIDAFGRKKGLQFFYITAFLGYGLTSYAQEVYQIYIGRTICGIGSGLYPCATVYLVEICTKKQREYLFSIAPALLSVGVLLAVVIGGYLPWQTASLIFSLTALVILISQYFIPESPLWLAKQGERDAFICALQTLGKSESKIRQELDTFEQSFDANPKKFQPWMFLQPTVWKPFVILVVFFFLQSASGLWTFLFYSVDLAERLGTTYNPLSVAVGLSVTRLLATSTIVLIFRSRVGRKFSTAISGFGMMMALTVAGVYEYVERDVSAFRRPFQWIPVVSLLLYMAANIFGIFTLPWLMSSEMFPMKVRGTMSGVSQCVGQTFMFVSVKAYYVYVNAFRIHELLLVFAGFSFVVVLFSIFVLPETQNKSLLEIEQCFSPKRKRPLITIAPPTTVNYGSMAQYTARDSLRRFDDDSWYRTGLADHRISVPAY